MGLSPRLEVRQAQSLTLTPQLMQSIRLLQLSHLELNAFVDAELLRNPLLEREDAEEGEAPAVPDDDGGYEDTVDHGDRIQTADAIAGGYDTEVENVFPEQAAPQVRAEIRASAADGETPDLDQYVAGRPTLSDHLAEQAGMILQTAGDRLIARALIDSLDDAGYLTAELDAVAAQLGAETADVEAVLLALQGCDPVGVFARDLKECLAIQLRERDRLDPIMQKLIANLELFASHDIPALLRAVGCDRDDLVDMVGEIRRLDPKPGRAFDSAPVDGIVPDVFVRRGTAGDWVVELNTDILPRVLVNRTYYAKVSKGARDGADKTFLTDCLQSANWLTKSLDQRAQTILKVATEIVRQQDGFLTHGVAFLKPMTLKLVAEAIGMHESTVSRVTSNKYVSTPRGLFEMKYFFTTALMSATGDADHSAEAVRHRIRELVAAEAANDVLSDDTIAELLQKEQGIAVARRTVAKYREGMNIPSSVIRRRQKRTLMATG